MPDQHERLHMFPRLHPMWHKSQLDFDRPDLARFPDYALAEAYAADLYPGDVLYLPPYVWHHVESVTASVSFTTLSHDTRMYAEMDMIYTMDHKFDLLGLIML